MKKLIMLALVVISLCSMAVTVTTNGPKPTKEHDVFAVKCRPVAGFSINDVGFGTDLHLFAREDMGDYWLFLFDVDGSEGLHGVRATLPVNSYKHYPQCRMIQYWDGNWSPWSPIVSATANKLFGVINMFSSLALDDACFGWKIYTVETNFYPLIQYKNGEPFLFLYEEDNDTLSGDLGLGAATGNPPIPEGSMLYYLVVSTNISVRLDML